jgi:hypothetical protein
VENTASFAFVDKKHSDIRPNIVVVGVPEPQSLTMCIVLGAGLLLGSSRRRMA